MDLNTPISALNRVGTTTATKLKSLDLLTVSDLIYYWPFRYDDFSKPALIKDLKSGERANIVGTLEIIQGKRTPRMRKSVVEALISDSSGMLKVIWFNQPFIATNLKIGDLVSLSGKCEEDFSGLFMPSPTYEKLDISGGVHTQGLVPNYHLTFSVTQKQIRSLINQALKNIVLLPDWLPVDILKKYNLLSFDEAARAMHFPKSAEQINLAKRRLGFDELLLLQLQAQGIRRDSQATQAQAIEFKETETKNLVDSLPFVLTPAQKMAAWEILQDLTKTKAMLRILNGDVGSGKTVVALLALYNIALNQRQAVLMAPTEILAKQHFLSLSKLLAKTDVVLGLATSNQKELNPDKFKDSRLLGNKIRKLSTQQVIDNADIIIGTQALIVDKLIYKNLNLVVVDEQHRFGVRERQKLLDKAKQAGTNLVPHLLTMTATPIPRTLALALYDDLNLSVIKQMPVGRLPIQTQIFNEDKRTDIYKLLKAEIDAGRQAFIICPLIDPSDNLGAKSVKDEYEKLKQQVFPDLEIGLLHGKLNSKAKEQVMSDFAAGKTKILVATAVVEVGVDVPNASVMLIESAERFGLAQLHQYRGRVGRGTAQSYCWLIVDDLGEKSQQRLANLQKYSSGFDLARADLEFRGPGEVYGTLQSGFPELKIASLFDYELMKQAKDCAIELIKQGFILPNVAKDTHLE